MCEQVVQVMSRDFVELKEIEDLLDGIEKDLKKDGEKVHGAPGGLRLTLFAWL